MKKFIATFFHKYLSTVLDEPTQIWWHSLYSWAVFSGDCLHNHVLSSDSNPTVCMSGQNSRKLRGVIEVADFAVSFIPLVCGIINKKELKFSQNSNNYAKSKQYSKICLPGNQRHILIWVCFIKTWNFKNRVRMSSFILLAII